MGHELQACLHSGADLAMGVALASTYFRDGAGLRLLLPQLLQQISHAAESNKSTRRMVGMLQRRTFLLGLCAAFPLPTTQTWPLPLLRQVVQTLDDLSRARGGTQKRDQYEPVPS